MGKGFVGRWLELHRPCLAFAVTVVVVLVELADGHGGSKTSLNKIKSPWYVSFALHPLHHQHLLHPCRSITAPTRTIRFHALPCANLHLCCNAPRRNTTIPARISTPVTTPPAWASALARGDCLTCSRDAGRCALHGALLRAPLVKAADAAVHSRHGRRGAICLGGRGSQGLCCYRRRRHLPSLLLLPASAWAGPTGLTAMLGAAAWPIPNPSLWVPRWMACLSSHRGRSCGQSWWLTVGGALRFQCAWHSSQRCRLSREGPKCGLLHTVDRCWQLTIKVICKSHYIFCTLFGSKHGSGNASIDVRADIRSWSMLVLRFNVGRSKVIFLSPVKPSQYLRLKIHYPRRHRPIRLPRGAPAVLSECNIEDPRCFWRGQISTQRPRWRHHLCLLHMKRIFWRSRPSFSVVKLSYLSRLFDSLVVAQKLQPYLGWVIPNHCTLFPVI